MVWPSLISLSLAPGSYFFWAAPGPADSTSEMSAALAAASSLGMFHSRFHSSVV